jgi:outer membrane immunogenic protein
MSRVAFAAALAACVSVCGGASAADLSLKDTPEYYPPSLRWTGFYVGGHLGGAFTDVKVDDTYDYNGDPFVSSTIDSTGLIVGLQLGYNIQRGNIVLGVEADLGYLDISGSESKDLINPMPNDRTNDIKGKYSVDGGLYGDLTGRLGYASDKTLLYVKGGVAFLNADYNAHYVGQNWSTVSPSGCNCTSNASEFKFGKSETLVGWTIGVGLERALSENWSLKAEYQHFDFGSMSLDYSGSYEFKKNYYSKLKGNTDIATTVDAVKVGVNYRFNGGDEALK